MHSWIVDGVDPGVVLSEYKERVLAELQPPQKWYVVLDVEMVREDITTVFGFRNKALVTLDPSSVCYMYIHQVHE